MTKSKYENEKYNPPVYPIIEGELQYVGCQGITLFDHYVGQIAAASILADHDEPVFETVEYMLDERARMLEIEVPE